MGFRSDLARRKMKTGTRIAISNLLQETRAYLYRGQGNPPGPHPRKTSAGHLIYIHRTRHSGTPSVGCGKWWCLRRLATRQRGRGRGPQFQPTFVDEIFMSQRGAGVHGTPCAPPVNRHTSALLTRRRTRISIRAHRSAPGTSDPCVR